MRGLLLRRSALANFLHAPAEGVDGVLAPPIHWRVGGPIRGVTPLYLLGCVETIENAVEFAVGGLDRLHQREQVGVETGVAICGLGHFRNRERGADGEEGGERGSAIWHGLGVCPHGGVGH